MSSSGKAAGASLMPDYHGAGTPETVVTAAVGKSYLDQTNGALYFKKAGAGNTGWTLAGGVFADTVNDVQGVGIATSGSTVLFGVNASQVFLGDVEGWNNSGNGLYYIGGGGDGNQHMRLALGAADDKIWQWLASGLTNLPGALVTVPTDSHTATAAWGGLTLGTPVQNQLGYDVCVNVAVLVTAAAGGSFRCGVGPTATPTKDPASPALAIATMVSIDAIVPSNYYLSVDTTGTITAGTPVLIVTPL